MIKTIQDPNRFTQEQQKEILKLANDAYDRGGADVLKIVLSTANELADGLEELKPYARFVTVLVEAIRQQLSEVVTAPVQEDRIITV